MQTVYSQQLNLEDLKNRKNNKDFTYLSDPKILNNLNNVVTTAYAIFAQSVLNSFILLACILLAGLKLVKILKKQLHRQCKGGRGNVSTEAIRLGLFRVRITMVAGIGSTLFFLPIHCVLFMVTPNNRIVSWIIFTILFYRSVLTSTVVILTLVCSPKALNIVGEPFPTLPDNLSESHDDTNTTISTFSEPVVESTLIESDIETQNKRCNFDDQSLTDQIVISVRTNKIPYQELMHLPQIYSR
ncbi:hypothetical protein [Parasitella parasitica]|uniref:Uncharacterized protein n=1 Tax=Parasitella parasitica TaxID=35722 RepID=A0A0B7N5C8_9FUNG|nr:hypothetical protein [Parasitella parasitica]